MEGEESKGTRRARHHGILCMTAQPARLITLQCADYTKCGGESLPARVSSELSPRPKFRQDRV